MRSASPSCRSPDQLTADVQRSVVERRDGVPGSAPPAAATARAGPFGAKRVRLRNRSRCIDRLPEVDFVTSVSLTATPPDRVLTLPNGQLIGVEVRPHELVRRGHHRGDVDGRRELRQESMAIDPSASAAVTCNGCRRSSASTRFSAASCSRSSTSSGRRPRRRGTTQADATGEAADTDALIPGSTGSRRRSPASRRCSTPEQTREEFLPWLAGWVALGLRAGLARRAEARLPAHRSCRSTRRRGTEGEPRRPARRSHTGLDAGDHRRRTTPSVRSACTRRSARTLHRRQPARTAFTSASRCRTRIRR